MFSQKPKKNQIDIANETKRMNEILPLLDEMEQHITQIEKLKIQILYPAAQDFFAAVYDKYKLEELKILVDNYKKNLTAIVGTEEMFDDKMSKITEKKKFLDENKKELEIIFNKVVNISKNLNDHPINRNEEAKTIASEFFIQQKKLLKESYVIGQLKKGFSIKEKGLSEEQQKKLDEILFKEKKELDVNLGKLEKPGEIDKLAKNITEDGMSEFIRQEKQLVINKNISLIKDSLSLMELKIAMLKFENVSKDVVNTIEEGKTKKINDIFKIQDILQKFKDIAKSTHDTVKNEKDTDKQIKITEVASEVMIRVFQIFNRLHGLESKLDREIFSEIKSNVCNMMLNFSEESDAAAYLAQVQEWLANKVEIRADFIIKITKKSELSKGTHVKNLYKEISTIIPKQNLLAGYGLLTITPMQQKQLEFSEKLFNLLEEKKLGQIACDNIIKSINKVCHKGRTLELFDDERKKDFVKIQCEIMDKQVKHDMEVELLGDVNKEMNEKYKEIPCKEQPQMWSHLTNQLRFEKVEKIVGKEETKKIMNDKKLKEMDEVISNALKDIEETLKPENNINSSPSAKKSLFGFK